MQSAWLEKFMDHKLKQQQADGLVRVIPETLLPITGFKKGDRIRTAADNAAELTGHTTRTGVQIRLLDTGELDWVSKLAMVRILH